VYSVLNPDFNRVDAAKRLRLPGAHPADIRAELELVASINHPNVVRIYFAAADENYYVMEYVPQTLEKRFIADPEGVRAIFVRLAMGICEGLQAAHRQRICHRDLKPDNILLDADGVPKIADFGLARFVDTASPARTFGGTPNYMAPEIWNGEEYGLPADIYSLGVIFYRIWADRFPYDATSLGGLSLKVVKGGCDPVETVNPRIPARIARLIGDMLAPAGQRISSVEFIIGELAACEPRAVQSRTVDDRQFLIASIYGSRNYRRSPLVLVAHLATNVSGLVGGLLAEDTEYGRARAEAYFPRVFAWICAVLSSLEWRVSQIVHFKYDSVCPYCGAAPCNCDLALREPELNRLLLKRLSDRAPLADAAPQPLGFYKEMFATLYGEQNKKHGLELVCLHAVGAVNDVFDALLRVRSLEELRQVDVLHLELADLVAWYFALLNMYDPAFDCERALDEAFDGQCYACKSSPCRCDAIEHEIRLANWRDFGKS